MFFPLFFIPFFFVFASYFSRYLDPELVRTTMPDLALPRTGDVVILDPFLKLSELKMLPVMDPSGFCTKRVKTGIPSCGTAASFFLADPNRENPDDFLLAFSSSAF